MSSATPETVPRPADAEAPVPPHRPRRGRRVVMGILWLVVLGLAGTIGVLALTGKPIRLPVWVVAEAEARLNAMVELDGAAVSLDGIEVTVGQDWVPHLKLRDLRVARTAGDTILALPEVRLSLAPGPILSGRFKPSTLALSGAQVRLNRDAAGQFDLVFGAAAGNSELGGFAELLDAVDKVFEVSALSELTTIQAEGLSLTLADARAGRVWQVGDGRLMLENRDSEVAMELRLSLLSEAGTPAQALLSVTTQKASSEAHLRATIEGVPARDIAAQAPPLAFLSVLDAPISGRLNTTMDARGVVSELEGSLTLAQGALHPTAETRPVAFERATLALRYDPAAERVDLSEIAVESTSLRLKASGHVDVPGVSQGLPREFLTQLSVAQMMVDPEGLFTEPVVFSEGALDLRLRLDPFRIDLGQLVLVEGGRTLQARGRVSADVAGWRMALDLGLDEITHDRLLALWPVSVVAKTRKWLAENVLDGTLSDVKAALRAAPGQEPVLTLGYAFSGTDVRFLKTLPPIQKGHGYATIEGNSYTMVLDRGEVTPPEGGVIDMSGSVFSVLDILQRPAQAEVHLKTSSSLTAALSLLDEPPFNFLTKAGRPVALGEGRAKLSAVLRLPLVQKVRVEDVSYQVEGELTEVRSEVLVPGRVLTAPRLAITAGRSGMEIRGEGKLGQVPFNGTYTQPFTPEARGHARVTGTVELSPLTIAEFDLGLPADMVAGKGRGEVVLDLVKGEAPRLTLTSGLEGITLRLPEVGWQKPAAQAGNLTVEAVLAKPVAVPRVTLEAPGLTAEGRVELQPDGGLAQAVFPRFKVGGWLDAEVTLIGRGAGRAPAVALTGGTLSLADMPDRGGDGGNARAGSGSPLELRLDRVKVSEGISLTDFRGSFSPNGGLNGQFSARVNEVAEVTGTVVPAKGGSAVRVQSQDAGSVLASAGIFDNARGGALDLQLMPDGAADHYRGTVMAKDFRVRNAPVLAALLSAVSVVGILEQLNGEGLVFSDADAVFRLTPAGIEVTRSAAVGASMGVSMAGTYDFATRRLNMQGVISPIYLLNGIGAILTRRGEGLFGFNYQLRGTSETPQISVNPLSILTPGMFREIFRQPPPNLGEGNG